MTRFANERAPFSYTGLTPSEHSSGASVRRGHISRQGSSRIRQWLVETAWRALPRDTALKESFDRIAATRGKKRAIVAIARRLTGRIRACFRQGTTSAVGTYASSCPHGMLRLAAGQRKARRFPSRGSTRLPSALHTRPGVCMKIQSLQKNV